MTRLCARSQLLQAKEMVVYHKVIKHLLDFHNFGSGLEDGDEADAKKLFHTRILFIGIYLCFTKEFNFFSKKLLFYFTLVKYIQPTK